MNRQRAEYLQPPMRMAGSFGKNAELEYMLVAYFHLRVIEPWDLETIKAKIKRCAAACHFLDNLAEDWEFDAYAAALYRMVFELKHSPVRTGLSDRPLSAGETRVEYFLLLAHEGIGAVGALLRYLAVEAGYTPEELCEHPGLMTEDEQTYGQCYDALLDRLRMILKVMDKSDFSRMSAMQAATDEKEDRVGLTSLLLCVSDEVVRLSERTSVGMRCVWPRRMRVLVDEADEIQKRFRSEAMNPLFLEGMADYGRRGAMALAAYVARSCQWDALCQGLENWMYEALAQTYALCPEVQRWMRKVCPGALRHLTGSLIAAAHSPRWHASLKTRMELLWLYRSLEMSQRVRREHTETEQRQA